jgi:hypothetical protein
VTIRSRILLLLAALALVVGLGFVFAQPAHAVNFKVCNDSRSDETIQMYTSSYNYAPYLDPGECSNWTVAEGTRVDVDVTCCSFRGGGGVDVDSYRIYNVANGTWGPCHEGETNSSDPPNGGAIYWTSTGSFCQ